MNSNYTLDDIANFIEDYKNSQRANPNDLMASIPLIGRKIHQKAVLEEQKRVLFEQKYAEAKNGSIEEQEEFIKQMIPILDDFYSKRGKKKR